METFAHWTTPYPVDSQPEDTIGCSKAKTMVGQLLTGCNFVQWTTPMIMCTFYLKAIEIKNNQRLPGACIVHMGIITTTANNTFKPTIVINVGIYWLVWSTKGLRIYGYQPKTLKQQQIRGNNSNKRLSDNFGKKITNVALIIADPLSKKFGQGFPPLM